MSVAVTILEGGIGVLEPAGKLVGGKDTEDLRRTSDDLAAKEVKKLLIDLSNVDFLDSSGVGTLVSVQAIQKHRGCPVYLCGVRPQVLSVLTITHLAMLFEVFGTREDALLRMRQ
ncbi:MAG: STAS domain-containing protein [Bacteroidota bacterium]